MKKIILGNNDVSASQNTNLVFEITQKNTPDLLDAMQKAYRKFNIAIPQDSFVLEEIMIKNMKAIFSNVDLNMMFEFERLIAEQLSRGLIKREGDVISKELWNKEMTLLNVTQKWIQKNGEYFWKKLVLSGHIDHGNMGMKNIQNELSKKHSEYFSLSAYELQNDCVIHDIINEVGESHNEIAEYAFSLLQVYRLMTEKRIHTYENNIGVDQQPCQCFFVKGFGGEINVLNIYYSNGWSWLITSLDNSSIYKKGSKIYLKFDLIT